MFDGCESECRVWVEQIKSTNDVTDAQSLITRVLGRMYYWHDEAAVIARSCKPTLSTTEMDATDDTEGGDREGDDAVCISLLFACAVRHDAFYRSVSLSSRLDALQASMASSAGLPCSCV